MSFSPVRNLVATVAEASPAQFDDWRKSWRAAVDGGSAETLLTFVARATRAEIEKALKKYYGVGAETLDEMGEGEPMELELAYDKEITEGDQEASVIKFVNQIIWEAFKDRATDIHFEPQEDELRIRN